MADKAHGKLSLTPSHTRVYGLFLVLMVVLGMLVPASKAASMVVTVDQNFVTVSMNLELRENFTSLPQAKLLLDASNSTAVLGGLETAARNKVPDAHVDMLRVTIETRLLDLSTQLWSLQENYTFRVSGAGENFGGLVEMNLAFLSMNVSDSIRAKGLEINSVGTVYLLEPLKNLPVTSTTQYFVNGHIFTNEVIPGSTTSQFNLLDFTWVPALSQWSHQYQVFDTSRWEITPSPPFNLTVGLRQVEGVLFPIYGAVYQASLEITAPPRAWSDGSMILFNLPTTADLAMPGIIITVLAMGLVTFFVDRRLSRIVAAKRRRR